jgi:hypothetical protein
MDLSYERMHDLIYGNQGSDNRVETNFVSTRNMLSIVIPVCNEERCITDRKSLLALRALAGSRKPKSCVSMSAE